MPWINGKHVLKDFAKSLELDEEYYLNRPDEAKLQAMLIQMSGGQVPQQPAPPAPGPGQGAPPQAGQPGFSGNNMSSGNAQGVNGGEQPQGPPI